MPIKVGSQAACRGGRLVGSFCGLVVNARYLLRAAGLACARVSHQRDASLP